MATIPSINIEYVNKGLNIFGSVRCEKDDVLVNYAVLDVYEFHYIIVGQYIVCPKCGTQIGIDQIVNKGA